MMTGTITNRRAHLVRPVRGAGGSGNVEFTIDTGYTALLTMPPTYCTALKLKFVQRDRSFLADGSFVWTNTYEVIIDWDGEEREVDIIAIESDPLIGMTMLDGYRMERDVKANR